MFKTTLITTCAALALTACDPNAPVNPGPIDPVVVPDDPVTPPSDDPVTPPSDEQGGAAVAEKAKTVAQSYNKGPFQPQTNSDLFDSRRR